MNNDKTCTQQHTHTHLCLQTVTSPRPVRRAPPPAPGEARQPGACLAALPRLAQWPPSTAHCLLTCLAHSLLTSLGLPGRCLPLPRLRVAQCVQDVLLDPVPQLLRAPLPDHRGHVQVSARAAATPLIRRRWAHYAARMRLPRTAAQRWGGSGVRAERKKERKSHRTRGRPCRAPSAGLQREVALHAGSAQGLVS
jgi:hypothetical protein